MQNSGGAVIRMRQEYEREVIRSAEDGGRVTYILGTAEYVEKIRENAPFAPFADETVQFLGTLSERLFRKKETRKMPEVTAFAFWCRMAHLRQLKAEYAPGGEKRLGRGVSLHFAPSNMPVLFAFTMAAGMLAGNSVIVRLPQKRTVQEEAVVCEMAKLLEEEFPKLRSRYVLCRYPHDREVTDALSALCDVRVVWGSDASVEEIRKSPLPPRAVELPFASRSSAAVFCADAVNRTEDIDLLAREFYNDTYLNDQNACSSPQIIYWLGTDREAKEAGKKFWGAVSKLLAEREYPVPASVAVQKLDAAMLLAAVFGDARIYRDTNRLVRVQVSRLCHEMWDYTVPGGFFIESRGETLEGMTDILTGRCQTICTLGVDGEALAGKLADWHMSGVDRIVPVGHALDFSLTWDGFDLIESMSRRISVTGINMERQSSVLMK